MTTQVLIENCVVYNPPPRVSGGGYQECIDFYPVDKGTIRGCWLYHTPEKGGDILTFCKGGSTNITWENNVFGPAYSDPSATARAWPVVPARRSTRPARTSSPAITCSSNVAATGPSA